jgi:hypothetical protein
VRLQVYAAITICIRVPCDSLPNVMKIRRFEPEDAKTWDSFVQTSAQGTFLHTRRFLNYHRDRFQDVSVMFEDDSGKLRAVLPAAVAPTESGIVVSHPGLTFGGLIYDPRCNRQEIEACFEGLSSHYADAGFSGLVYKTVPMHAQRSPTALDLWSLWRRKASIIGRDVWNMVVPTTTRPPLRKGHKANLRTARLAEVVVRRGEVSDIPRFHSILAENLASRHEASPVHSPDELVEIIKLFPEDIDLWLASGSSGQLHGGVLVFRYHYRCWHTQYIASTQEGRAVSALSLLLEGLARQCREAGRVLSFGSSTESGGAVFNDGLFHFKSAFGSGSASHDVYELPLK